jgi:hypothetical protein
VQVWRWVSSGRSHRGVVWEGQVTRRERFLAEMDAVIPWPRLGRLIEPHYPKAERGRQPLGLEKMLRIYFLQQRFNLSDPREATHLLAVERKSTDGPDFIKAQSVERRAASMSIPLQLVN